MKNFGKQALLLTAIIFVALLTGILIGRIYRPNITINSNVTIANQDETKYILNITDTRPYIDGKININAASADDFMLLPGIGSTLAQRIIDYRSNNGPYESIDQILNVPGIGVSNFNKIKNYLTIGG